MNTSSATEAAVARRRMWRRVHRPEEYAADMAKFVAVELKLPPAIMIPFVPVARAMMRRWENAGVEYTEHTEFEDGTQKLRTVFLIHNYSNSRIYNLLERCLKMLGVAKRDGLECADVDYSWRLLGGILMDFASRAGVTKQTTQSLLEFRLCNSDYETATTWRTGEVEIANLRTGRVETLELPPPDVEKIVRWAVGFHKSKRGRAYCEISTESPEFQEFEKLRRRCDEITGP
jgi:hypothetical protein